MTHRSQTTSLLLDRIPHNAQVVLHLGCGDGSLGAEYKRRNPRGKAFGVERDKTACTIADAQIDKVISEDDSVVASRFTEYFGEHRIDCLLISDLSGEGQFFCEMLRQFRKWMNGNAVVLFDAPNLEYYLRTDGLLRGVSRNTGISPKGARTIEPSTLEMTSQSLHYAGFGVFDVVPIVPDPVNAEAFVETLAPSLDRLGIGRVEYLERARAERHVWRARSTRPNELLTIVSTMLDPVGGVSHVRVVEPMRALGSDPDVVTSVIANGAAAPADVAGPRIFIFHRPLLAGEYGLRRIQTLLKQGWIVVCEFDDHPDYIPVLQRPDLYNFRGMHAIQTSTKPLATVMAAENPEVAIFENAIERIPPPQNFQNQECMTLFFAGLNREGDWPPFVEVFNDVANLVGPRLHFHIVSDRGLFDALKTENKAYTPLCDYDTYRLLLSRSEISFMPLDDNAFNRCKSDLKFIEASAHRVISLASTIVYADSIENNNTGVLFQNADDLRSRLMHILTNGQLAKSVAENARKYVADQRMLSYQIDRRIEWYRSLWQRRESLTKSLLSRIPALI